MLYLALACQPGSGAPPRAADTLITDTATADTATQAEIRVITATDIAASPTNPLAAVLTVTTDAPAQVTARWVCGGRSGSDTAQIDGTGMLEVWGVRAETGCDIAVEAVTPEGTERISGLRWTSGALPAALPVFTAAARAGVGPMAPGVTLVSTVWLEQTPEYYAVGVDEEGEIVWVYLDPGGYRREHHVRDMGDGTLMLLMDRMVRRITPGGRTIAEVGNPDMGLNHHDALPLPGGDVLFLVSGSQTVDVPALGGEVLLQGDRLVRVAGAEGGAGGAAPGEGDIVWEWSAFDHLDTQRFPGPLSLEESRSGLDWTHGNGLALSPDGNSVLYSARSQSWIVNISLDTGEVGWILGEGGDFALDPAGGGAPDSAAGWFYNQHAPQLLPDGTILLYDNGNERPDSGAAPPLYSRAVRYALDTDAMTAAGIWGWASPRFTIGMGDANLLPGGNVLVTNTRPPEESAYIVEVDAQGREVWALTVSGAAVYRAERIGWPGG